jgi:hypothetical protein
MQTWSVLLLRDSVLLLSNCILLEHPKALLPPLVWISTNKASQTCNSFTQPAQVNHTHAQMSPNRTYRVMNYDKLTQRLSPPYIVLKFQRDVSLRQQGREDHLTLHREFTISPSFQARAPQLITTRLDHQSFFSHTGTHIYIYTTNKGLYFSPYTLNLHLINHQPPQKWRTAKQHIVCETSWRSLLRRRLYGIHLPLLAALLRRLQRLRPRLLVSSRAQNLSWNTQQSMYPEALLSQPPCSRPRAHPPSTIVVPVRLELHPRHLQSPSLLD